MNGNTDGHSIGSAYTLAAFASEQPWIALSKELGAFELACFVGWRIREWARLGAVATFQVSWPTETCHISGMAGDGPVGSAEERELSKHRRVARRGWRMDYGAGDRNPLRLNGILGSMLLDGTPHVHWDNEWVQKGGIQEQKRKKAVETGEDRELGMGGQRMMMEVGGLTFSTFALRCADMSVSCNQGAMLLRTYLPEVKQHGFPVAAFKLSLTICHQYQRRTVFALRLNYLLGECISNSGLLLCFVSFEMYTGLLDLSSLLTGAFERWWFLFDSHRLTLLCALHLVTRLLSL
ncbi:hypothetical protein B0H34DRAFT_676546 [Crassisporium funariophilum]|nr:hypothetical protein B0H34DRAFT_676546 [Crassisporium funariophilum]